MEERLSRRLLVVRVAALGGTTVALNACVAPGPTYSVPVRGTGITDADPNDGPGQGRGGRRGTGITDADPNDGPGQGRGGYRGGTTGRTDSDPRDAPGRGRY